MLLSLQIRLPQLVLHIEGNSNGLFGEKLNGVLVKRKEDLSGILNGIDEDIYNPETDLNLAKNY